jgi:hypothetical protein
MMSARECDRRQDSAQGREGPEGRMAWTRPHVASCRGGWGHESQAVEVARFSTWHGVPMLRSSGGQQSIRDSLLVSAA